MKGSAGNDADPLSCLPPGSTLTNVNLKQTCCSSKKLICITFKDMYNIYYHIRKEKSYMDKKSILTKYGLWEKAQNEIQKRKIDKVPYDMEGRNNVYCELLGGELIKRKQKKEKLLNAKCVELENLPPDMKKAGDDCSVVGVNCSGAYCRTECAFYKDHVAELDKEIKELSDAIDHLQKASGKDRMLR